PSTIRGMLNNPTYVGRAVLGRWRYLSPQPQLRPRRGCTQLTRRKGQRVPAPREEWIEVAVPAVVDPAMFEATQAQLAENRKRKRASQHGTRWLLQGLTVCSRCGYSYYGRPSPRSPRD